MRNNNKLNFARLLIKWIRAFPILISLVPVFISVCRQDNNSSLPSKYTTSPVQAIKDISDAPANRERFEKQKAIWESKKVSHYKVDFIFSCDCPYRTTQLKEVVVNGEPSPEKSGETITVEVQNGSVLSVRKENGERATIEAYQRNDKKPSDLPEYKYNVGNDAKYGKHLISDPIAYLWARADERFRDSPAIFNIIYDGTWGYIKYLEVNSDIPDDQFKAYINNFIVLD